MTETDREGVIQVELEPSDILHLTHNGTTTINKNVGPINIRIKFGGKVYPVFKMEDKSGKEVDNDVFRAEDQ